MNILYIMSLLLVMAVVFVNGWTDAPNAIATTISTRSLSYKTAIMMASIANFLGVFVMCSINNSVAFTIYNIASFSYDTHMSLIALLASMSAIVLWSIVTWYFGIPTSESHALIAGICGGAIALNRSFSCLNIDELMKVFQGIVLSVLFGYVLGYIICFLFVFLCSSLSRLVINKFFVIGQIISGALLAFMHGAQDGQKFIGIFLLCHSFAIQSIQYTHSIPLFSIIICSLTMALGTSLGGMRIIKSVGLDMVKLKPYQALSSDLSAFLCLFVFSILGIPVSTTHTKTCASIGVGSINGKKGINWIYVKDLILAWILTFPMCGILGYLIAKLYLLI